MHSLPQDHTGTRIARLRRERHLSQKALSELSQVPYSTLTKVEQGRIPASPHVIGSVARAMRVDVATIQGQPYLNELRADQLDLLITPIRRSLDVYDLGVDPDIRVRRSEELHRDAENLCASVRAGEIKSAASRVAGLIEEGTTAAHASQTHEGWLTLASFYRSAYDVAAKLGYPDLAQLSLARLDWAAKRGSDAVLGGMYHYLRSLTYLRDGQYRTGGRLVELGLATIAQAESSRERQVVTGQIHLGAAVIAGRAHDEDNARNHLSEAERIAGETGEAAQVHWLAFGPTNVGVHRVSVLAELDQYGKAVEAADQTRIPADWPKSRTSHHYAEVARAQLWTGRTEDAFKNLLMARKVAPQQAKYHPTVRETYAGLEAAHRRLPDSFLSYGAWLGPAA
ncbi:helix-turn-helix domain-containing protein [Streptomyces sp. V3I7]|uniref:helix-turn-helix domain-containing protein n=1 Tax=Streptomyces sp. V3I7 TaxID=3042278 RepID=UPI002782F621|nr:helix-turn-helix transcriptional regulator [Streptomyces sp. V3I7]MDQ0988792.1 transcriptional regulator with XRE-family HTH domain [Streptomyces sp. V3I7]